MGSVRSSSYRCNGDDGNVPTIGCRGIDSCFQCYSKFACYSAGDESRLSFSLRNRAGELGSSAPGRNHGPFEVGGDASTTHSAEATRATAQTSSDGGG